MNAEQIRKLAAAGLSVEEIAAVAEIREKPAVPLTDPDQLEAGYKHGVHLNQAIRDDILFRGTSNGTEYGSGEGHCSGNVTLGRPDYEESADKPLECMVEYTIQSIDDTGRVIAAWDATTRMLTLPDGTVLGPVSM